MYKYQRYIAIIVHVIWFIWSEIKITLLLLYLLLSSSSFHFRTGTASPPPLPAQASVCTLVCSYAGVQQRGQVHIHLPEPRGACHLSLQQLNQVVLWLAAQVKTIISNPVHL